MLYQFYPSPLDNIWVPFGFCTCDENTELELGGMYEGLLRECTFQELYDVHEALQLVGLFYSKGWANHLLKFPFLIDVLNRSPGSLTVWHLKQVVINNTDGHRMPIGASIKRDYGFINCTKREEEVEFLAAYLTFFKRPDPNPPALHEACMEGEIFDYLHALLKLKDNKLLNTRLIKC